MTHHRYLALTVALSSGCVTLNSFRHASTAIELDAWHAMGVLERQRLDECYTRGGALFVDHEVLTSQTARTLAKYTGPCLYLTQLTALDANADVLLEQWGRQGALPSPAPSFEADPGGSSAGPPSQPGSPREGRTLVLPALEQLDADTAEQLARWEGQTLVLDGLNVLEPETLARLGGWRGGELSLDGLDDEGTLEVMMAHSEALQQAAEAGMTDLERSHLADCAALGGALFVDAPALRSETAGFLRHYEGACLYLEELTTVDDKTLGALVWNPSLQLHLRSIGEVDTQSIEMLSLVVGGAIHLSRMTSLNATTAEVLTRLGGMKSLHLDGLTSLDPDTAEALALWEGEALHLNGLSSLDAATAEGLALWRGRHLHLNGLSTFEPGVATALLGRDAQYGQVYLDGLTGSPSSVPTADAPVSALFTLHALEAHSASIIDRFPDSQLEDCSPETTLVVELSSLHPLTANQIGHYRGDCVYFSKLTSLQLQAAEALAPWKGKALYLNGLSSLGAETAGALALWKGKALHLNGLRSLRAETAEKLIQWGENYSSLHLNGLRSLPPETVEKLAQWDGSYSHLHLNGLTSLPTDSAAEFAHWETTHLYLGGLTHLDSSTARQLAKVSHLFLDGLQSLDLRTARALGDSEGWLLSLGGLTSLDPQTAGALAAWKGRELHLNGLSTLSPSTAAALVAWNGREPIPPYWVSKPELHLNGLSSLSAAAAARLAEWRGGSLHLNGISSLSDTAASELAQSASLAVELNGLR